MKKKRPYTYVITPNVKHIGEVPTGYREYRKLLQYIGFVHNYKCYHCDRNFMKKSIYRDGMWNFCLDFLDDTNINLRDENLVIACTDHDKCKKRIKKNDREKLARGV